MRKNPQLAIMRGVAISLFVSLIAWSAHCHGDESDSTVLPQSLNAQIVSHLAEWKKAVRDFDQPAARKATQATKMLGYPAIRRLVAMLDGADLHSKAFALESLRNFRESASIAKKPILRVLYTEKDPGLIVYAIQALDFISYDWADNHIDFLIHLLDHENDIVRAYAIRSLLGPGPRAKKAIIPLINIFKNNSCTNCKAHAADALCCIAPTDPRVIAAATTELEKGNAWAPKALLRAGPAARPLIPLLTRMLALDQPFPDPDIAIILGRVGPTASPTIPLLIKRLNTHGQGNVSQLAAACATALGEMGIASEEVVSALTHNVVADDDDEIVREAILALGRLGHSAKASLPALFQVLTKKNSKLRADAAGAIGLIDIRKGDSIALLRPYLNDADKYVRLESALALARLGDESEDTMEVIERSLCILRDGDFSAIQEIEHRADIFLMTFLAMSRDPNASVRSIGVLGLGVSGRISPEVITALSARLLDDGPIVRKQARESLNKFLLRKVHFRHGVARRQGSGYRLVGTCDG